MPDKETRSRIEQILADAEPDDGKDWLRPIDRLENSISALDAMVFLVGSIPHSPGIFADTPVDGISTLLEFIRDELRRAETGIHP